MKKMSELDKLISEFDKLEQHPKQNKCKLEIPRDVSYLIPIEDVEKAMDSIEKNEPDISDLITAWMALEAVRRLLVDRNCVKFVLHAKVEGAYDHEKERI